MAKRFSWSAVARSVTMLTLISTAPCRASDASLDSNIQSIDRQISAVWEAEGLRPSRRATDREWCRRVFLDVIGRIPTVEELRRFIKDRSATKRAELVESLLYDANYVDEYARNWSTIWTNILIGRTGGTENNSLISRAGMTKYLRRSFAANKPYDDLVYELVTATGTTLPGDAEFNGATNYLIMKLADKDIQATARTAQVFLGMQVQCTQCHNHPFNEWKQNQFWELNAFFRQAAALRRFEPGSDDVRLAELVDQDFRGEGSSPDDAEIYYEMRNGLLKAAYPVFVDGHPLDNRSGYVRDVNRRQALAQQIVASDLLGKAIVNRMWAHFLGYGFTKPIDDMGPHNPPSHPTLLDQLANELRDHNYDLKRLIQWLTLSQPYGLSSRTLKTNATDDPQLGESPKFSHFYLRQMRAQELYESLLVATEADRSIETDADRQATRDQWLKQFSTAFGTDEGGETTTFNGTIPQALMMFHGELIRRATELDAGGVLTKTVSGGLQPAQQIDYLFEAALARRPTKKERQVANNLMMMRAAESQSAKNGEKRSKVRGGDLPRVDPRHAALQDIWWAVLNSSEFILNH